MSDYALQTRNPSTGGWEHDDEDLYTFPGHALVDRDALMTKAQVRNSGVPYGFRVVNLAEGTIVEWGHEVVS